MICITIKQYLVNHCGAETEIFYGNILWQCHVWWCLGDPRGRTIRKAYILHTYEQNQGCQKNRKFRFYCISVLSFEYKCSGNITLMRQFAIITMLIIVWITCIGIRNGSISMQDVSSWFFPRIIFHLHKQHRQIYGCERINRIKNC